MHHIDLLPQRLRRLLGVICLLGLSCLAAPNSSADAIEDFYKGKQLTFYVGYEAGSSYDIYTRMLAPHLVANLPGKPGSIVRNMPGASTVALTNYMYNVAPRDGSVLAAVHERITIEPLFNPGSNLYKYDALKLQWIGSIAMQTGICFMWHQAAAKTYADLLTRETIVGAAGRTGDDSVGARVMNAVLGTKLRLIEGYESSNIYLAIERREIDGRCGFGWPGLKATRPDWIRDGKINVLLQLAMRKHPELPDVPLIMDLVRNEDDRGALKLLYGTQVMGRPIVVPQDVPSERVAALRVAFDAAVRAPELLAEAKRRNLDVDPVSGREMHTLLEELYAAPKPAVERVISFRAGER